MAAKTKPTKKSTRSFDKKKQKKNSQVLPRSDVTTRKQMKDDLVDSERSFTTLAEHAPDIIVRLDKRLRHLYVNPAMEKATGIPLAQFIGKTNEELGMPKKLCTLWNRIFRKVLRTGDAGQVEFSFSTPDGMRSFELRAVPESADGGSVESVLVISRDITDRKRAEQALSQARDTLEIKVQKRTAELVQANKQLREENAERLRAEHSLRLESARLDALLRLSQMSEVPLYEITAFTLEQTIALTQSKIGFVGFLSKDEAVYTLHAVSKDVVKECAVAGDLMHWPVADAGMWADAIRKRKTLFVNDYSKPNPRKHGIPAGHVSMERFMVVPVFEGKRIVAVAGVGNKASDYDKSDERQVTLLLSGMWGSVQKNRAREELQKAHDELEEKVKLRTAELSASNEALRLSQKNLEHAEEVGQMGWWRMDVERNVLTWSDENHRIFGIPKGTPMTYETFLGTVHPDDWEYVDQQWQEALRGKPYDIEHRIIVDGQVKWVREKAYLEFDDAGTLQGGFGITRDITVRKRTDEALRRLSQFPQENPNPVLRVALDGALFYANEPAREWLLTLGWEAEGPLPARLEAVVAEAHGQDHAIKTEITNPAGRTFYLFAVQPSGEDYINIYGLDITEHKQAEEAVRKSEERYRGLYEAVSGGLIVQDREGTILEANAAACDMLGLTQDQIRGLTSEDLRWRTINEDGSPLLIDDRPPIRALHTGIPVHGQVIGVFNPALDQYRWLLVNAEPILDPRTSQVQAAVSTFLDITDRKKKEEELQRLNRTLRALSNSNQALMHVTEESAYLQDICKIIVEDCGHEMVWIGFTEEDEGKTVRPVASAGFEEGYLETLHITWADTERGRGPTGTAIRTGKMSMCRNMLTDPNFAPWREQAIKRGYASSIVLPLLSRKKVFGAVNIYSKEPDPFTDDEVKLLTELAGDLAYGIQSLRLRAAHAQAEEALRKAHDELEIRVRERTADLKSAVEKLEEEIAERRRAEEELSNTKEVLEKTMSSLVDAVFVVEPVNRTIIACNKAVKTMFGYPEREVIGRNTEFLYVNREMYEEFGRRLFLALDEEGVYQTGYDMRRNDGTVFPADITVTEMVDDAGERRGTVSLVRDMTERVRAQEERVQLGKAIEEAIEDRLRLAVVMEQTAEGVMITDTKGTVEYVNSALEGLSGYRRDELVGRKSDVLLPYAELGEAMETVRRGESWRGQVIRRHKGGNPLELDITVSPVRNAEGEIINYVAIERDVTREMQLQRQMRQMQKMEALGTLAGGIAHDLNNILMPITINTELALDIASEESPARLYLQQALEAAHRGTDLVRQITAFSRRKETAAGPAEILPVVKEALQLLRSSLPATIEIRQRIKARKAVVQVDPVHIHQVLMNLSTNAADALRPGGGLLEVSLDTVELDPDAAAAYLDLKPGPYVRLTVADTGHGMDESVKERIFDPFFTTKGPDKGTGMGLAVVHGIVKSVGGGVTVYSEKGKGTQFNVYLPQVRGHAGRRSAATGSVPTGTERILFVDDEEAIVHSVRHLLERLGYTVITTTSSPEALELFRSQPEGFDLVITDQTMPQMTGVDLAEEIMRIRPGMPVILCTGFSEQMSPQETKARGIRAFIMKPLTTSGMAEVIRHALAGEA